MKFVLNIPPEEQQQLIRDRTPRSDPQQPSLPGRPIAKLDSQPPFLSKLSLVPINEDKDESSSHVKGSWPELVKALAQNMVCDRKKRPDVPKSKSKTFRERRREIIRRIRGYSVEDIEKLLGDNSALLVEWIAGDANQQHTFSSLDLPPIRRRKEGGGEENGDEVESDEEDTSSDEEDEGSMKGLAGRMYWLYPDDYGDGEKYASLFSALEQAVIQCSDMEGYMRVSVWLFLAALDVWHAVKSSDEEDKDLAEIELILRSLLRNYVTLVLLCEEMPMEERKSKA